MSQEPIIIMMEGNAVPPLPGLYRHLWTYTPAVSGIATQVTSYSKPLPSEKVPMSPGRYVLVYWSNHYKCVLGMSPLFRISLEEIVNVTGREETGVDMLAS